MTSKIVNWTKRQVFATLFSNFQHPFWRYFVNFEENVSFHGLLDKIVFRDVCLEIDEINVKLSGLQVPFQLSYGHFGRVELNLHLTQSKSVLVFKDILLVFRPGIPSLNSGDVLQRHIQEFVTELNDIVYRLSDQQNNSCENFNHHTKPENSLWFTLKKIVSWITRYDPNLVVHIKNLHIRVETVNRPFISMGITIDSIMVNPDEAFWEFKWPNPVEPDSKLVLNYKKAYEATAPDPSLFVSQQDICSIKVKQTCSSVKASDTVNGSGKPIFLGSIRNIHIYCNDGMEPWIPLNVLEKIASSTLIKSKSKKIYEMIPPDTLYEGASHFLRNCFFVLISSGMKFQLGIKTLRDTEDSFHGIRFTLAIVEPLRFHMTRSVVFIVTRLCVLCSLYHLHRKLSTAKFLSLYHENPGTRAQEHWKVVRYFIHCCLKKPSSYSLRTHLQTYVNPKRKFMAKIRQYFLSYHLTHIRGRFRLTNQFPTVYTPFQILQKHFVLGDNSLRLHADKEMNLFRRFRPMTDNVYNINHENLEMDRKIEFCSFRDFVNLGFKCPPQAYFYLAPTSRLKETLGSDFEYIAHLINIKGVALMVQWYLLAVREAEELLRFFWHNFLRLLVLREGGSDMVSTLDIAHTNYFQTLQHTFSNPSVINVWVYALERNIITGKKLIPDLFSTFLETYPLSERIQIKMHIATHFIDFYSIFFSGKRPDTFHAWQSVFNDANHEFTLKEALCDPQSGIPVCVRNVSHETSTEPPALLESLRGHRIFDMPEDERLSWEELLKCSESSRKKVHNISTQRWEIPFWLQNLTLGILVDCFEVIYQMTVDPPLPTVTYSLCARAFGFHIECQRRLYITMVLRELLFLNLPSTHTPSLCTYNVNPTITEMKPVILGGILSSDLFHQNMRNLNAREMNTSMTCPPETSLTSMACTLEKNDKYQDSIHNFPRERENVFEERWTKSAVESCEPSILTSPMGEERCLKERFGSEQNSCHWILLTLSFITPSLAEGEYYVHFPLYLDLSSFIPRVYIALRPFHFDQLQCVVLEFLKTYYYTAKEALVGTSLTCRRKTHSRHSTVPNTSSLFREIKWLLSSVKRFVVSSPITNAIRSFWLEKLKSHISAMENRLSLQLKRPLKYYNFVTLPTLVSTPSEALNNLHINIRLMIPPLKIFCYALEDADGTNCNHIAELDLHGDLLFLATVRRRGKPYIFASSSRIRFTTEIAMENFLTFIPTLYGLMEYRIKEIQTFLNNWSASSTVTDSHDKLQGIFIVLQSTKSLTSSCDTLFRN